MIYNELDMYDTDLNKAFPYGSHVWIRLPNSTGIMVIKCAKCKLARLWLVGHDILICRPKKENVR